MKFRAYEGKETYYVLVGGSWAVGEYNIDEHKQAYLSGLGVGHFLSQSGICLNLAMSGASNIISLRRLERFLSFTSLPSSAKYIWVVSSPLFDCASAEEFYNKTSTLTERTVQLLDQAYLMANQIANEHNITLHLIGGAVDLKRMTKYERLKVLIPSWCKMMFPDFPTSLYSPHVNYWSDLGSLLPSDYKKEWLEITELMDAKLQFYKREFINDDFHPLSKHHLILKNRILDIIHA